MIKHLIYAAFAASFAFNANATDSLMLGKRGISEWKNIRPVPGPVCRPEVLPCSKGPKIFNLTVHDPQKLVLEWQPVNGNTPGSLVFSLSECEYAGSNDAGAFFTCRYVWNPELASAWQLLYNNIIINEGKCLYTD